MGIVLRQSFKNVLATYLGFAIGALNTLFLFTYFLCHHSVPSYRLWGEQYLGALLYRLSR